MTDLSDRLAALRDPGVATANAVRPPVARPPRGWEPGIRYEPGGAMTVTTDATGPISGGEAEWAAKVAELGLSIPDGFAVRLVEAKYDPAAWHRHAPGEDAVTAPIWRYKFSVSPVSPALDIDDLIKRVRRANFRRPAPVDGSLAYLVAMGDTQVGKCDGDGPEGTVDRVLRSIEAQAQQLKDLRREGRPIGPVYLTWLGDCVEGFLSQGGSNAWRTTLTLTEQVRIIRRLMLHQVEAFRGLSDRIVLLSIPGNHDESVRFGGKGTTRYDDSWAVEAAVQVGDAIALNDSYSHVSVAVPGKDELTLTLDIGGTIVGFAHGHMHRAGKAMDWWAQQAHGMQPIGNATLLLTAHLHHLRVEQGGAKTWMQVPAQESESTWWRHRAGQVAPSGAVTMTVGPDGWDDLRVV